jgi:hypothetical protein
MTVFFSFLWSVVGSWQTLPTNAARLILNCTGRRSRQPMICRLGKKRSKRASLRGSYGLMNREAQLATVESSAHVVSYISAMSYPLATPVCLFVGVPLHDTSPRKYDCMACDLALEIRKRSIINILSTRCVVGLVSCRHRPYRHEVANVIGADCSCCPF